MLLWPTWYKVWESYNQNTPWVAHCSPGMFIGITRNTAWSWRSWENTLSFFLLGLALSCSFTVRACCTHRGRAPGMWKEVNHPFMYCHPLDCKCLKPRDKILLIPLALRLLLCLFFDLIRGNQTTQNTKPRTEKTGIRGLCVAERAAMLGVTCRACVEDPC